MGLSFPGPHHAAPERQSRGEAERFMDRGRAGWITAGNTGLPVPNPINRDEW